jgi:hypothetical protein
MANTTIPSLSTIASPSSAGLLWVSDPNASPQDRSLSLANLLSYLVGKPGFGGAVLGKALSSTPYTLAVPFPYSVFLVTTGASAFVFNLPTALSALGSGPVTIVKADSGAGAIAVTPNGTDTIGNAGNVACYLGAQWQAITLVATVSGQWSVLGGVFVPHQTVDTDGTQLFLGKLRHLPLGNTTDRTLFSGSPPAISSWSGAQVGSGIKGIPVGAKAVRVKVYSLINTSAAVDVQLRVFFSDNNSFVPALNTSHPLFEIDGYSNAASNIVGNGIEIDIPLNSSGQFFIYTSLAGNVVLASTAFIVTAVGYYMGD